MTATLQRGGVNRTQPNEECVPADKPFPTAHKRSILICDGEIVAIQPELLCEAAMVIDGTGMIARPGMVDAHQLSGRNVASGGR